MSRRRSDLLALLVFVAVVAAAASFGAVFKPGSWYTTLAKPSWTPPSAVFAPVWTALYVMIAIAGWLAWRSENGRGALVAWVVGLVCNAMWSWLFFGRHSIGAALIDIAVLWCTIVAFVVLARKTSPWASLLFLPYLLWVSFAAALNFAIWQLNG